MADNRIVNLARTLVQYSTEIKEKDLVGIVAQPAATPLVQEVYREVLRAGAYPYLLSFAFYGMAAGYEGLDHILFSEANEDQLQHVDRIWKSYTEEFDAEIFIIARENTRSLAEVDLERLNIRRRAYADVTDTFMRRSTSGELRRVSTLYPTQSHAQDANLSLEAFTDFVSGTTFSDTDDPISMWRSFHDEQQRLVEWLSGKKTMRVEGPDIDMEFSIEGRAFVNSDGRENMPDGEIFTGPVEESANGWVKFTHPAIYMGHEVSGVKLRFKDGKVVEASAITNEDFLLATVDTDEGSHYIGEFAIGTNDRIERFSKMLLFDEKIGGTIHMALGAGYPNTGSRNKSAIHWDMICDMRHGGEIRADGEKFYESGRFLV